MSALLQQMRQDSPLGLWPLATDANDVSGNGINGTPQGGVTFGHAFGGGLLRGALFDRTSAGWINLGRPTAWTTLTAWTIEAWLQTNIVAPVIATTGWCGVFSESYDWQGAGTTNVQMELGMGFNAANANDFRSGRYHATPGWTGASSGITPVSGRLYHLVGTYDGTNHRIYVDGVLRGTAASAASAVHDGDQYYNIGRRHDAGNGTLESYLFPGYLSHMALYGTALSENRIKARYFAGMRQGSVMG